jgi:small subunit ribosomal protein S5
MVEKKRTAEEISQELLEKEIVKDFRTDREKERDAEAAFKLASWVPKTKLGKEVKEKKIKNIDEILNSRKKILEEQVVDSLLNLESDLLFIGQSKGKFGGGKRRAWKQTQRKTKEGNVATFATLAVVGDKNGHVGIGRGRAKETLPARDKAIRKAKLEIIKINRGCASFDCSCNELHSIPYKVEGKSGSVRVTLIPAPQGTGLVAAGEMKRILKLAGIKDIYTRTFGTVGTTTNLARATMDALRKTNKENKQ